MNYNASEWTKYVCMYFGLSDGEGVLMYDHETQ